jgi:hypothetical protein
MHEPEGTAPVAKGLLPKAQEGRRAGEGNRAESPTICSNIRPTSYRRRVAVECSHIRRVSGENPSPEADLKGRRR